MIFVAAQKLKSVDKALVTVTNTTLKGNIIVIFHEIHTPHSERGKTERSPDWQGKVAYKLIFRM